nr:hypothetical protein [uncultured Pontibacter sp.]
MCQVFKVSRSGYYGSLKGSVSRRAQEAAVTDQAGAAEEQAALRQPQDQPGPESPANSGFKTQGSPADEAGPDQGKDGKAVPGHH